MAESRTRAFSKLAKDVTATGDIKAEGISSDVTLGGATIYATRSALPVSGNSAGDQAYVTENNRLYIWNGSGWYNVALLNLAPAISSVQDSDGGTTPFTLAIDGTATTITITAADSDGDPITYSATADSDFSGLATISQADNVFTITPFSQDSATTQSGTITFTATDGINISSDVNTFTLNFVSPYWDETVLSIGTSSTNSLGNSTFIDRSTNAHTVTPTGTPIQTAFHPYLDNWSVEFDGTGDYLIVTDDASLEWGSSDITLELWYKGTDTDAYATLVSRTPSGFSSGMWSLMLNYSTTGDIALFHADYAAASPFLLTTSGSVVDDQWHHIALVRNGNDWALYVDGVSKATRNSNTNTPDLAANIYIGRDQNYVRELSGNISNLRFIKGTALYTSNFTPPTEKLTAVSGTSLLTCQSNRFVDNSTNAHAITISGDPKISAFNPFGQESEYAVGQNKGSTYLSGSSKVDIPLVTALNAGTDSYSFELWVYFTSTNVNQGVIGTSSDGFAGFERSQGTWAYYQGSGATNTGVYATLNEWHHVVICRNGSSGAFFVDGQRLATFTDTGDKTNRGTFNIGYNGVAGGAYTIGYISDYRYVIGSNPYDGTQTTLTVPTAPVGNTNASLYLPMDNAGIFDKTGNNTLTLAGNTSTSTTQTKFADTAMYFDGTGDGAEFGDQTTLKYLHDKTSNYTIECWMYPTSVSGRRAILMTGAASASTGALLELNGSVVDYTIYRGVSGSFTNISGGTVTVNQWSHIAVTYDGTTVEVFLNGTSIGSTTWSLAGSSSSSQVVPSIGRDNASSTVGDFIGYLENFQILNGVAKYTANFTPPTRTQGRTYQAEN